MFHTNKRGRNREMHASRVSSQDDGQGSITEAEFYLAVGKTIRRQLRRGYHLDVVTCALGHPARRGLVCFAIRTQFPRTDPACAG